MAVARRPPSPVGRPGARSPSPSFRPPSPRVFPPLARNAPSRRWADPYVDPYQLFHQIFEKAATPAGTGFRDLYEDPYKDPTYMRPFERDSAISSPKRTRSGARCRRKPTLWILVDEDAAVVAAAVATGGTEAIGLGKQSRKIPGEGDSRAKSKRADMGGRAG